MSNIPIGKTGLILSGEHKNWHIRVEPAAKGGHLILFMSQDDPKSRGYDHWVLENELEKYFDELNIEIRWLDS